MLVAVKAVGSAITTDSVAVQPCASVTVTSAVAAHKVLVVVAVASKFPPASHWYVNGPVPPAPTAVASPSQTPLHEASFPVIVTVNKVGSVTV